ncbi:MAG: hypothetical protein Q9219_004545 [cf. Caloplaca sp. 3 TL-2023]
MATRSRAAIQAVLSTNRTPTPQRTDTSDGGSTERQAESPASIQSDSDDRSRNRTLEDEDLNEEDHDQPLPAHDWNPNSRPVTPAHGHSSIPTRRRAGRPPRARAQIPINNDDAEMRDAGSDVGTPRRRGGWRGRGFGGGRWGKPKGGPSHVTQVPLDKEGNMANVKDDEVELPDDPEGERKVNRNGTLLDGREYKVRVFTISGKNDRLYMLSTEPARCIGFRDSYLFFQKHKTLCKIILTEEEKRDLIQRALIPHSYKGRAIGVVTARSVFREFGAKIIIGGKKVVDDYQAAAARARGDIEGELANPEDKLPGEGDAYDKNRFVAWHGASSVYHTGGPSVPLPNGRVIEGKKRKVIVTGSNWMLEHAREASRFNTSITLNRRQNLAGVYDLHTNALQYSKIMQPTHARWEACTTGYHWPSTTSTCEDRQTDTKFPPPLSALERNFLIADTYYASPLVTSFGVPGPDRDVADIGPPDLPAISHSSAAAVPFDCRATLEFVQQEARNWKTSWNGEDVDGARAQLHISYNQ